MKFVVRTRLRLSLRRGVTLIELLLIVGIFAIIASIVLILLKPNEQVGGMNDAQRRSDANAIVTAVYQYAVDHGGNFPAGIDTTRKQICAPTVKNCGVQTINLDVIAGEYIIGIPLDPVLPKSASGTQYFIVQDAAGHITVDAPRAEESEVSVSR